jgi:hypothetical protein
LPVVVFLFFLVPKVQSILVLFHNQHLQGQRLQTLLNN